MDLYICENVFVPLRSGPSHRSEMLSQVLFGEKYLILDHVDHWIKVQTIFDKYEGWIDINHLQQTKAGSEVVADTINRSLICLKPDGTKMVLEAGCDIYLPDFEQHTFKTGSNTYKCYGEFSTDIIKKEKLPSEAGMKYINSPYIWGGRIPSGIDCSGFTQLSYKVCGIAIPRDSWQQAEAGTHVSFINEAKPGDLLFFDDDRGRINHVGMLLSEGLIIHASGRVRIDRVDHQGIYKQEIKGYSHRLRTIRRILQEF